MTKTICAGILAAMMLFAGLFALMGLSARPGYGDLVGALKEYDSYRPAGGECLTIQDGLPPGTAIQIPAIITAALSSDEMPGGPLGGTVTESFGRIMMMDLQGGGALGGFHRAVNMNIQGFVVNSAPHNLNDPLQSFDTDLFALQGQLPPGDPDFDLLRITAGTGFGLPSPGHTTLTQLPGDNWAIDSFFDITYRIDFVGAPGGPLGGMSGSTTGTIRLEAFNPNEIPEPASLALVGAGLAGLGGYVRRRRRTGLRT